MFTSGSDLSSKFGGMLPFQVVFPIRTLRCAAVSPSHPFDPMREVNETECVQFFFTNIFFIDFSLNIFIGHILV